MTNPLSSVSAPSAGPVPLGAFGTPVATNLSSVAAAFGAWTAYTPAWTSSGTQPALGNGTISGRFNQLSKCGWATGSLTMGSTTTFGTGTYFFSVPSGWSMTPTAGTPVGVARILDDDTSTRYIGLVSVATATTLQVSIDTRTTDVEPTTPMTWAQDDSIVWDIAVELT